MINKRNTDKLNVLFLAGNLSTISGVTKHLYYLIEELSTRKEVGEIFLVCSGGELIKEFQLLGIYVKVIRILDHEKRNYAKYVISVLMLLWIIKKENISIVHSHNHYLASMAYFLSKVIKIKTIQTNHGILPTTGRLKHFYGDKIIAVNQHIFEHIIKNKIKDKADVKIIQSGISVKKIEKRRSIEKIRVIAASRLTYEKGIDIYIKAINLLPINIREKAEFYIAGTGDYEDELRKLNIELNTGVVFLGKINNMMEFLKKTEIFIFPTRLKEGFPMVIIEAGINKNIIIASECGGYDTFLEDKNECLKFPVDDFTALSNKIENVIRNNSSYENMINKMYEKIVKNFDIKMNVNKLIELYES